MMRPLGYAVAAVVDRDRPTTTPPPPTTTMTWAEAHHVAGLEHRPCSASPAERVLDRVVSAGAPRAQ